MKIAIYIGLLFVLLLGGCTQGGSPSGEHMHGDMLTDSLSVLSPPEVQGYTCAMHPHIHSEEPGPCPICGMAMTPVTRQENASGIIQIDPITIQNIGVRTASVTTAELRRTIRTTGRFEMDEQGAYTVTLKAGGWVETLHIDYEGALVEKGQPLLELYSPELVAAQEEYLLALRHVDRVSHGGAQDAQRLLEAARRRLTYWDVTEQQISRLEETLTPQRTLTFYAPASGEVMNKSVVAGQRIVAGHSLMDIVDISRIWLIADIYEQDLGWIEEGAVSRIELPYQPGQNYQGRVDHIYLMMDTEARSARARIVLSGGSTSRLKPGMYATVYIEGGRVDASLVVPEEAIIRTGEYSVAILALGNGRFQPREVRTGVTAEGLVQVLSGLEEGDRIVTSAQFLIDSEVRLKGAIGAMHAGH
ncbi:MAG: efflux RND transporter periplasmic adaptor subunit [Bacteroidetes bacterium]|nr:efflux RND transporter periplasmic adaptor subunit [Bacteroidota bacterium]